MRAMNDGLISSGLLCAAAVLLLAGCGGEKKDALQPLRDKTTLFKQRVQNFLTQVKKTEDSVPKAQLAAVQKVLQAVRSIKAEMTIQFDPLSATMPEPFIDENNTKLDELEAEFKKIPRS